MDPTWTLSPSSASNVEPPVWRGATASFKHFESPECPECGYLGWTPVLEVKETEPRTSRERRRAARRLPSVA